MIVYCFSQEIKPNSLFRGILANNTGTTGKLSCYEHDGNSDFIGFKPGYWQSDSFTMIYFILGVGHKVTSKT